jgi:hypothetical protein
MHMRTDGKRHQRLVFRAGVGFVALWIAGYGAWRFFGYLARRDLPPLPPPSSGAFLADTVHVPLASVSSGLQDVPIPEVAGRTRVTAEVVPAARNVVLPPEGGTDVIPDEYVLFYEGALTRALLLEAAWKYGIEILGEQDGSMRILARDRARLAAMLRSVPGVEIEANVRVLIPVLDEPNDALAAPLRGYRGFSDQAPAWLGVPQPQAWWGRGVTVAILDTGVSGVPVTRRIDLVSSGGVVGEHGAFVAGIVANMLPGAALMDVQVMSADGVGDTFTVAQGIRAAVDAGAGVINMSLGTRGDSRMLAEAVRYAQQNGVLVVASAGNEGVSRVSYPAAYDGVLSVAAVDAEERHVHFSNRGAQVDIAAPGVGVSVRAVGDEPVSFSGTSAAAPFVTATAGLAMGLQPGLDAAGVSALILATANDTGSPGVDPFTGHGIVNPLRVLENDRPGIVDVAMSRPNFEEDGGGGVRLITVLAQNRGTADLQTVEMSVSINGHDYKVLFHNIGRGEPIVHQLDATQYRRPDSVWDLTARVDTPGDVRPENNQIRAIWLPVAP